MSQTMPNCRRCGRPYTTPGGGGYCEDHRQFPLCTKCGGSGWCTAWARHCDRCDGTRHEREPRADFVAVDEPVTPKPEPALMPEWAQMMYGVPVERVERLQGETRQEWRRRVRAAGGGA